MHGSSWEGSTVSKTLFLLSLLRFTGSQCTGSASCGACQPCSAAAELQCPAGLVSLVWERGNTKAHAGAWNKQESCIKGKTAMFFVIYKGPDNVLAWCMFKFIFLHSSPKS
jgi:hypothetical protein